MKLFNKGIILLAVAFAALITLTSASTKRPPHGKPPQHEKIDLTGVGPAKGFGKREINLNMDTIN